MPSSHQRNPPNTSRRTHTTSARQLSSDQEIEERLRDDLKNANTELNKVNSERDRYQRLYGQAVQKLSETQAAKEDLKAHLHTLKEDNAALRQKIQDLERENDELTYETAVWDECWTALEKSYINLVAQYRAVTSGSAPNPVSAPVSAHRVPETLPERPRLSHRSSGRREHKEDRAHRDDQADREHRAEMERLSRRFDEKRPTPIRGRRHSFVAGWGAVGGPGASASAPHVHAHAPVAFAAVPRTADFPSGLYQPSTNAALYDTGYEDGNYHAFPLAR